MRLFILVRKQDFYGDTNHMVFFSEKKAEEQLSKLSGGFAIVEIETEDELEVEKMGEKPSMTTDEAQEYLVKFMEGYFTDRTFHRYILGTKTESAGLAVDFSWQMAQALQKIQREAEADKLDAARYRWMRNQQNPLEQIDHLRGVDNGAPCYHVVGEVRELKSGDQLDYSIDAAMRENLCH